MKSTLGIITLLLISQSIFAEGTESKQTESQPIKSDAAVIEAPAEMTTSPVATAAMEEKSGFSRGSVVRSAFTRTIDEREPTEDLENLSNDHNHVKFFTELRDMSGQTAIHRWEYEGKVVAEIKFNVKGPRWRVWSSKNFVPQWTGDWKVSVVNAAGEVISEKNLSYDVAAAAPAAVSDTDVINTPATTATESTQ